MQLIISGIHPNAKYSAQRFLNFRLIKYFFKAQKHQKKGSQLNKSISMMLNLRSVCKSSKGKINSLKTLKTINKVIAQKGQLYLFLKNLSFLLIDPIIEAINRKGTEINGMVGNSSKPNLKQIRPFFSEKIFFNL